MRKNSKSKGNRFERSVCKAFQNWSGYEFSRTPASGGLRWKKADNISSKHAKRFSLSIECKSYHDIKFEHLLLGMKSCKIDSFWNQANRDAERAKKIPVLIMRYNSMPKDEAFFMVNEEVDNFLKNQSPEISRMEVSTPKIHVFVYMFKEVQRLINYGDLHKYVRKLIK